MQSVILEFFLYFQLQLPQHFTNRNETYGILKSEWRSAKFVSEFYNFAPKFFYDILKFKHVINFRIWHWKIHEKFRSNILRQTFVVPN